MKNLTVYINESLSERAIEIEKLPEDKRSVAKVKALCKAYDKKGDELEDTDIPNNVDSFIEKIKAANPKKAANIKDLSHDIYSKSDTKERKRAVSKFLNAVFSYYKSEYEKDMRKYGYSMYGDTISGVVIACSKYIMDWFGENDADVDKFIGKMLTAFEKLVGYSFDKVFANTVDKAAKAKEIYDTEMKTISDFKNQMKDFKYVYYCGTDHEAHGEIHFYETSRFNSFDEGFEQAKKDTGASADYFYNYSPDNSIKYMIKNDGKLSQFGFCSGYYYMDEENAPEKALFMFGFLNEMPNTLGKLSSYDGKMRYAGKVRKDKGEGHWVYYDSLWTVHKKEEA